MIPQKTIEELIDKHAILEKDLSSGDVDKKKFAEKSKEYSNLNEIIEMQNFYLSNQLDNILLLANKRLSFDKNLKGDFELKNNLLKKKENNDLIYIGCQILNRNLFKKYKIQNFSILSIWNELLKKNELNGFESLNNFYHLTNLEIFKKLKDF